MMGNSTGISEQPENDGSGGALKITGDEGKARRRHCGDQEGWGRVWQIAEDKRHGMTCIEGLELSPRTQTELRRWRPDLMTNTKTAAR